MITVQAECPSCKGTGLYRGMAEPLGVAVVCLTCDGTGCKAFSYEPFVGRKPRSDVRRVLLSRGSFILRCGPAGNPVTYEQFCEGIRPTS